SWEMSFYFFAAVGVLILAAVLFVLPKSQFFAPSNETFSRDMEGFVFHLKNSALLLAFGLGIVLQFSFTGIWTYLPFYLQEPPFSLSLAVISYMFFAYGLGIIGSPLAGWFAGKFGLSPVRIVGIIVLSAGLFMTLSESLWLIVA